MHFPCNINALFSPIVFEYFCILVSINSAGVVYIVPVWKAETRVDSMSPEFCDDECVMMLAPTVAMSL